MCEVASLIAAGVSLAASVAGSAMQAAGQEKAAKARTNDIVAENERQAGFRRQGIQAVGQATDTAAQPNVDRAMAAGAARRDANLTAATTGAPPAATPNGIGGNAVVASSLGANRARNDATLSATNAALANTGGWGDALFGLQSAGQRSAEGVAQAVGNARGTASTFPARLEADRWTGAGLRTAGDLGVGISALAPGALNASGYGSGGGWLSAFGGRDGGLKSIGAV